jgi:hypothetical protein
MSHLDVIFDDGLDEAFDDCPIVEDEPEADDDEDLIGEDEFA